MASTTGFDCVAQVTQSAAAKPKVKTIFSDKLLGLATGEITVPRLHKMYGTAMRVRKVSHNIQDPAVQDTLLVINTNADKLQILSTKYNAFLLKANFISQKLAFGKDIKVLG